MILHARITADYGLQQRRETRTILDADGAILGALIFCLAVRERASDADAAIRELGRTGAEARLVNLSAEGFMARTDAAIAPGSRVWLTLPGFGRINALVVWAKDGKLGGRFAEPIDPLAAFHAAGLAQ